MTNFETPCMSRQKSTRPRWRVVRFHAQSVARSAPDCEHTESKRQCRRRPCWVDQSGWCQKFRSIWTRGAPPVASSGGVFKEFGSTLLGRTKAALFSAHRRRAAGRAAMVTAYDGSGRYRSAVILTNGWRWRLDWHYAQSAKSVSAAASVAPRVRHSYSTGRVRGWPAGAARQIWWWKFSGELVLRRELRRPQIASALIPGAGGRCYRWRRRRRPRARSSTPHIRGHRTPVQEQGTIVRVWPRFREPESSTLPGAGSSPASLARLTRGQRSAVADAIPSWHYRPRCSSRC